MVTPEFSRYARQLQQSLLRVSEGMDGDSAGDTANRIGAGQADVRPIGRRA